MVTINATHTPAQPYRNKKLEYFVNIVINAIILIIVNEILNWGILPFLTQAFKRVLPIQNASLALNIAFYALFLFYDRNWFVSLLRVVLNAVSVAVAVRFLTVFPFDFSGSSFDWALLFRIFIVLGIVGLSFAIIVEFVKFIGAAMRRK